MQDQDFRPRRHDHLVEPMFAGLRWTHEDVVEGTADPGPEERTRKDGSRRRRWLRVCVEILTVFRWRGGGS